MSYSVSCSIKILTLTIALFWFILVGNFCRFYDARCVGALFFRRAHVCILNRQIQKDLKVCLTSCYYAKVVAKLIKSANKEFSCVVAFIMEPNNAFKFQYVLVSVNVSEWMSLNFNFTTQMTSSQLLPHVHE